MFKNNPIINHYYSYNYDPSDDVEGAIRASKLQWVSASDEESEGGDDPDGPGSGTGGGNQGGDDDPDGGGALS